MGTGSRQPDHGDQRTARIAPVGHAPGGRRDDATDMAPDQELMWRLADGDADALGPLYGRYVRLVLSVASQSLDQSAAEDLVQEVFLVVWRKASTFDPERGTFRSWLLEITHTRVLNELRRRSRRPRLLPAQGDDHLQLMEDPTPEPIESVLRGQRRHVLDEALAALPHEQQQALRLAFFSELTHEEVASSTAVPLGTAKSRIRTGLRRLRSQLNPLLVGGIALALTSGALVYQQEHEEALRSSRALWHVTMSDVQSVRLVAVGGTPADAHGNYRARPGADMAVLTVSNLPAPTNGRVYQAWLLEHGTWRSLGIVPTLTPDGHALLIAEGADLGTAPDGLMVTQERAGGASTPSDQVVISWSSP
jgi:RNA polymerase sigma-70 factor (ECF subfamily)